MLPAAPSGSNAGRVGMPQRVEQCRRSVVQQRLSGCGDQDRGQQIRTAAGIGEVFPGRGGPVGEDAGDPVQRCRDNQYLQHWTDGNPAVMVNASRSVARDTGCHRGCVRGQPLRQRRSLASPTAIPSRVEMTVLVTEAMLCTRWRSCGSTA